MFLVCLCVHCSISQQSQLVTPLDLSYSFPRPVWCFCSWTYNPRVAIVELGTGKDSEWLNNSFWDWEFFGPSNVPLALTLKGTVSSGKQGYKPASKAQPTPSCTPGGSTPFSFQTSLSPQYSLAYYMIFVDTWPAHSYILPFVQKGQVGQFCNSHSVTREQGSIVRYSGFKVLLCQ